MKTVVIVVPDCAVNVNSLGGALDILSRAEVYWQELGNSPKIIVQVAGLMSEQKSHANYLAILPNDLHKVGKVDLVIIPAILYDFEKAIASNAALITWIVKQYKLGAEIASLCSGAFLLGATGLLDGRHCSLHWNKVEHFAKMYPNVNLVEDQVITSDNGIFTSGGAYSFLNLIIYLVEHLFDREVALKCAKVFQVDYDRVSQSPFIIFQGQKSHGDEVVLQAQSYIEEHLAEKISFEVLSRELAVSRRNFDRRFMKATGNSPVQYQQRVKVEAAKRELEKGRKSILEVMLEVGYSDDKAFREVFKKVAGLSPLEYRNKYSRELI